jgi:hypothetical protein
MVMTTNSPKPMRVIFVFDINGREARDSAGSPQSGSFLFMRKNLSSSLGQLA